MMMERGNLIKEVYGRNSGQFFWIKFSLKDLPVFMHIPEFSFMSLILLQPLLSRRFFAQCMAYAA